MSRKKKKKKPRRFSDRRLPTPQRIEKALREHRTQQALELAKTLFKQEPTNSHKSLLKRASLARGKDLIAHGHTRDAAVVLANAADVDSDPVFLGQIAAEIARAGNLSKALELRQKVTDPQAQARIMAFAADEAVRLGPPARSQLPAELHGEFDALMQAFAHSEKEEDEAAREKLAGIGLRSPFLEWKVFLRGLLAYYQNDDERARENWQRLDAERSPFRLAAPLRFTIDSEFARQQHPGAQTTLQRHADRLQGTPLLEQLRAVQAVIGHEDELPRAFRLAEPVVANMKKQMPQMIPRLASCFYWAIIHHGLPEDMPRYRRVFGAPADDPEMARLEALALENRGEFEGAHQFWQKFEKSVQSNPAWPNEQKNRVRALVWSHMGANADRVPDIDDDLLPPFMRGMPGRPKPVKPTAEECYNKSIELAPDQLPTYEALFQHYLHENDLKNAEKAGRRLLQQFPDHAPTLEKLGDVLMEREKHGEALELFEKAQRANPLEQRLRGKMAYAHAYHARQFVEKEQFDKAREEYQAALSLTDGSKYPFLCKWAACEFKAGNTERAEELLQEAQSEQGTRLAVVFSILIETIRFKMNKLKKRFNDEFNKLLAEQPTAEAAMALADTAASHRAAGVKYYGQQTHEKKVLAYLDKARKADFTEQQLRTICSSLLHLKKPTLHLDYIKLGQRRFPNNPDFYLIEAQYQIERGPYQCDMFRVSSALQKARQLLQAQPRSDRQQEQLKQIQLMETVVAQLNPFSRLFGGGFGGPDFGFFDDDDDDDYDYDDDDFYDDDF